MVNVNFPHLLIQVKFYHLISLFSSQLMASSCMQNMRSVISFLCTLRAWHQGVVLYSDRGTRPIEHMFQGRYLGMKQEVLPRHNPFQMKVCFYLDQTISKACQVLHNLKTRLVFPRNLRNSCDQFIHTLLSIRRS